MRFLALAFILLPSFLGALTPEPNLSGLWSRTNGSILEARYVPASSTWSFFLVKAAPDAKNPPALGTEVISQLRWSPERNLWTWGKIRVPRDKEPWAIDCDLLPLKPGSVELVLKLLLNTRVETLQRVPVNS